MSDDIFSIRKSSDKYAAIYFDEVYYECLACWFRVCVSCSSEHRQHELIRVKSVRTSKSMPELNTNTICASCANRVKLGWYCSRCDFSICLTCHLAPSSDFRATRRKTSQLFLGHAQKHLEVSMSEPMMVCVRGELFFLRSLPSTTSSCHCCYDPNLTNHCGTCYIRKLPATSEGFG